MKLKELETELVQGKKIISDQAFHSSDTVALRASNLLEL